MIKAEKILPGSEGQAAPEAAADEHVGGLYALSPSAGGAEAAIHPMNEFFDDGHTDDHAWVLRG